MSQSPLPARFAPCEPDDSVSAYGIGNYYGAPYVGTTADGEHVFGLPDWGNVREVVITREEAAHLRRLFERITEYPAHDRG